MYSSSSPGLSRFSVAVTARHTPRFPPEKREKENRKIRCSAGERRRIGEAKNGRERRVTHFSFLLCVWENVIYCRGLNAGCSCCYCSAQKKERKKIEEARFFSPPSFCPTAREKGGGGLFPHINGKRRGLQNFPTILFVFSAA